MHMGADFWFHVLPACTITKERRLELSNLIEATPEEEVPEYIEELEDYKGRLVDAVVWFADQCHRSRETGWWYPEGGFYPVYVTGGMSWGDEPTVAGEFFSTLSDHAGIYTKLRAWAMEDQEAKVPAQEDA
jgi:hypothetical protein